MEQVRTAITKVVQFLINIFKFHKLKILLFFVSLIIFAVLIFPYDDLKDYITINIYKMSQKQAYVVFEKLGLSFFPTIKLEMNDVNVDSPMLSNQVTAKNITLSPSLISLLTLNYGGSATAENLLGGSWDVFYKQGKEIKAEDGAKTPIKRFWHHVEVEAEDVLLKKLFKLIPQSPVKPEGKMNADIELKADTSFLQQPNAEFELDSKKLILPPTVLNTPFGELPLPDLNFSKAFAKGRLVNSELLIEELELGQAKDPVHIKVKGKMILDVKMGMNVLTGPYDIKLSIDVNDSAQKKLGLFLSFLDAYKSKKKNISNYLVKISGRRFGPPPELGKLSSF